MVMGTFAECLESLSTNSIPRMKPWVTRQASGYDRDGGFYDSGNFLRIEPDRHYVLMEEEGPGCIDRMWFTYKSPVGEEPYDLLFFLDDGEKPALRINLDELFSGEHEPFVPPLAGTCGNENRPARFSYVPIGFQRACKVVLVPTAPEESYQHRVTERGRTIPHIYYQLTYRVFPEGTSVYRFDWPRDAEETEAVQDLCAFLNGERPAAARNKVVESVRVGPLESSTLCDLPGSGIIEELVIETERADSLSLSVFWDGDTTPAIEAPMDLFFASPVAPEVNADRGLWLSRSGNRFRCRLPMPFRDGATLALRSHSGQVIPVKAELRIAPLDETGPLGRLHAIRYDYNLEADGRYYRVLDVTGTGHFVGLVMDNPGHMEGDDRFFIDGEEDPSIHGTGTEDFFSFAWGLSHVARLPLHGISRDAHGNPVCYRFHLPAGVPFTKSLLIEWEHGHSKSTGPNMHAGRYRGLVFYYLNSAE
jgi:hypothetical protein